MRVFVFLLALLLGGGGAWAQGGIGGGGVGGNDLTYKFVTPNGGTQTTLGAALAAVACSTNCTFTTPTINDATLSALGATFNGTNPLTINTAPTGPAIGSIVNNVSTYPFPASGNERARYWTSVLDTTGSPMGLYESNFFFVELTTPGALSNPLITASLSGATVGSLAITTPGAGLTNGTYNLLFTGGGCSGVAGTATISGGAVTSTTITNAGGSCASVPTVSIAIGTVTKEVNQVHPYAQVDAGVVMNGLYDPGEVSMLNNGYIALANDWNALFHNGSNGVTAQVQNFHCIVGNDNPNAGSIGSSSCLIMAPIAGQTPTGTGGSITATQSGGSVTLSFTAGSGYQNGGPYQVLFTGGNCSREPAATFTVSGGQIQTPTLTFAGSSCTANPTTSLFFGSFPTFYYSALLTDPYATFATQGNMLITDASGNTTPPAQNNMLTIKASSSGGNQFLINGQCGVSGGNCFNFNAAGGAFLFGPLTTGSSGKNNGSILFTNAGVGSANITLAPPTGGAVLTAATVTIPDVTGTLAEVITPVTTSSIGGSALAAGACASTTVAATNSTTGMPVVASPVTYPGDGAYWLAYVSAAGTVTVKVCAAVAMTPAASAYNVRVIQ